MPIPIPKQGLALARALVEHFEACEKLNSIEQAISDSQAQVNANRITASEIVGNAKDEARAILAEAQTQRNAIAVDREEAKRKAADIIAKAQDEAAKISADAINRVTDAKKAESQAEAEERRAKKRLAEVQAQLAELEPKLAKAQEIIAEADAILAVRKKV